MKKTEKSAITKDVSKEKDKIVYEVLQTPEFEKWVRKIDKLTLLRLEARLKLIVQQGLFGNFRNLKKKLYELKWKDIKHNKSLLHIKKVKRCCDYRVIALWWQKSYTEKRHN